MITRNLAIALEGVGSAIGIAGLVVECLLHADTGYICITTGASVIAVGSLIWKFVKTR